MYTYKLAMLFLIGITLPISTVMAEKTSTPEKIKAAYTYQFTKFVNWPSTAFSDNNTLFVCILGQENINDEFNSLNQRKIEDRHIKVIQIFDINDINKCQILYISESEKYRLATIIEYLNNKPILSISSMQDFAKLGGIIDFVLIKNKVRFEINMISVKRSQLQVSAKLLEVSIRVFKND